MARVSNDQILAALNNISSELTALNARVSALEGQTSKKSAKDAPKKSASKKQEPKKSYEQHLTEEFGDKAQRTKFVELRKKVASEFSAIAEKEGKYIPKKSYKKVLNDTTVSLNGKFNKTLVKKAFVAVAR